MFYNYEGVQVSSPEAEGTSSSMTSNKWEFRVVNVIRIEEVTIVSFDEVHEMVDILLEDLWFTEEDK